MRQRRPVMRSRSPASEVPVRSARQLNLGSAILALSVLADSGIEHYRGSFHNRAMYTPLGVASLTLAVSLLGALDTRPRGHRARDAVYALSAATGLAGFGFHLYNVAKRPGGFSWLNFFYAAPIGAPFALVLAGLLGKGAESARSTRAPSPGARPSQAAHFCTHQAGRVLAALSAVGLAGTVAEAALLHFRGAFQNPAMVLPVSVPPVAAALLAAAAVRSTPSAMRPGLVCPRGVRPPGTQPGRRSRGLARWWLKLTALLGFVGVGFHARGIARNMGGWGNWSQNILNGPPLPAPPSFTGLALAGLAALGLMEDNVDE